MNDTNNLNRIARTLYDLRHTAGYSQDDVAAEVGTSHTTLGRLERGESWPKLDMLMRLCEFYGLSVEEFCLRVGI